MHIAKAAAVFVVIALLCVGCDGVYVYNYEGTINRDSKATPAVNVPVQVAANNSPNHTPAVQDDHRSDEHGRYSGSFVVGTGWVFALRPPGPKLHRVYLFTPSAEPIEVPLTDADQQVTSAGGHIALPAVTLPAASQQQ